MNKGRMNSGIMNKSRMKRTHLDQYKYFTDIQTRWNDNDIYGHVNNAVYYTWFDSLVNNWLIETGVLSLLTAREQGSDQIGLVVDTGCQYFAPLSYPQIVRAGLCVARIGNSSVRYEIGLFETGGKTACAQGHFVHVYVDANSRKPKPIPDRFRTALEALI